MKLSVSQVAEIINCEYDGDSNVIASNFERLENSGEGDLSFCMDKKFESLLAINSPSIVIINKNTELKAKANQCFFYSENAYLDFIKLISFISQEVSHEKEASNNRESNAIIGENSIVGEGSFLDNNVVLGQNVRIGKNTHIYPNVTIYDDTIIGDNCIIHANSVIGADGFGYVQNKDGSYVKIPQIGNVVIGNDVEVGANSCIDRAMIGSTIIGDGVKLDNLVQVAHNCELGEHTAIASQTGISGSAIIGKRVRIGGQVGISGHLKIADDITILAQSGVAKTINDKGTYFGSPSKPQLKAFKIEAVLNKLPEMAKDISRIKKDIIALSADNK